MAIQVCLPHSTNKEINIKNKIKERIIWSKNLSSENTANPARCLCPDLMESSVLNMPKATPAPLKSLITSFTPGVSPLAGVQLISSLPGPGTTKSTALYWKGATNAVLPPCISSLPHIILVYYTTAHHTSQHNHISWLPTNLHNTLIYTSLKLKNGMTLDNSKDALIQTCVGLLLFGLTNSYCSYMWQHQITCLVIASWHGM